MRVVLTLYTVRHWYTMIRTISEDIITISQYKPVGTFSVNGITTLYGSLYFSQDQPPQRRQHPISLMVSIPWIHFPYIQLENSVFYDIYQSDMTVVRRHGSPDCIWQYRTVLSRYTTVILNWLYVSWSLLVPKEADVPAPIDCLYIYWFGQISIYIGMWKIYSGYINHSVNGVLSHLWRLVLRAIERSIYR